MRFEEFFKDELEPLLAAPETFERAIEALEEVMPAMEAGVDRSQVYQWLGTLHVNVATQALQHGVVYEARRHFELVEEFESKAIEEAPGRMEPRLNLARYYLTFGQKPEGALEALTMPEGVEAEGRAEELRTAFEHQSLALRGVALTLLKRHGEAAEALDAAFGDRFAGKLQPRAVDVPSLQYLATRGIKFSPESAAAIVGQLRKLGVSDEGILGNLQEQLSA
jgi:tetratricopeptide (TPR) repeat protein